MRGRALTSVGGGGVAVCCGVAGVVYVVCYHGGGDAVEGVSARGGSE